MTISPGHIHVHRGSLDGDGCGIIVTASMLTLHHDHTGCLSGVPPFLLEYLKVPRCCWIAIPPCAHTLTLTLTLLDLKRILGYIGSGHEGNINFTGINLDAACKENYIYGWVAAAD